MTIPKACRHQADEFIVARKSDGDRLAASSDDPERIISAAVRASDGKIVRGYRHIDAVRVLQATLGYENECPQGNDQGFVTVSNRFFNRAEAYRLHFPERNEAGELQSDDLF